MCRHNGKKLNVLERAKSGQIGRNRGTRKKARGEIAIRASKKIGVNPIWPDLARPDYVFF